MPWWHHYALPAMHKHETMIYCNKLHLPDRNLQPATVGPVRFLFEQKGNYKMATTGEHYSSQEG